MTNEEKSVADEVRRAFDGVKLGRGIGLMEGRGLDDYASDEMLKEYRSQDEANDWTRIDIDTLNDYFDSLSYVDQEGMRFHLPAYILADLQGGLSRGDLLFHLCYMSNDGESRYELLNAAQRNAVRRFLLLRWSDRHYGSRRSMIQNALDHYWHE